MGTLLTTLPPCTPYTSTYTITLLHYYTITLLHYYTIILLHYYTITLLYYYTITLLHYYTICIFYSSISTCFYFILVFLPVFWSRATFVEIYFHYGLSLKFMWLVIISM